MRNKMRALLSIWLCAAASAARFWPLRAHVEDRGGFVDINMVPVDRDDGVLHLKMRGRRISKKAAERSIRATSKTIHKCNVCTIVVEMGDCSGVSPLALPVTAGFLISHPELKHILIIEAKGAVLMACRIVRQLSGHDKMDLYGSWLAFESACSGSRHRRVARHRRSALMVAKARRQSDGTMLNPIASLSGSIEEGLWGRWNDFKAAQTKDGWQPVEVAAVEEARHEARQAQAKAKEEQAANKKKMKKRIVTKRGGMKMKQGSSRIG